MQVSVRPGKNEFSIVRSQCVTMSKQPTEDARNYDAQVIHHE